MSTAVSLDNYLAALESGQVNLGDLVLRALQQPGCCAFTQIQSALGNILSLMEGQSGFGAALLKWAYVFVKTHATRSIQQLASKDNPWHFGAIHTTPEKLRSFKIEEMAKRMEETAPEIWELVGFMLGLNGVEDDGVDDIGMWIISLVFCLLLS